MAVELASTMGRSRQKVAAWPVDFEQCPWSAAVKCSDDLIWIQRKLTCYLLNLIKLLNWKKPDLLTNYLPTNWSWTQLWIVCYNCLHSLPVHMIDCSDHHQHYLYYSVRTPVIWRLNQSQIWADRLWKHKPSEIRPSWFVYIQKIWFDITSRPKII